MSIPDPKTDPVVARALRRVGAYDVHTARELRALRRRIVEDAEPLLQRRRPQGTWWECALAWRQTLVPIALSAAALAMFGILHLPARSHTGDLAAGARRSSGPELLDVVANRVSSGDLIDLIAWESDAAVEGAREHVTPGSESPREAQRE